MPHVAMKMWTERNTDLYLYLKVGLAWTLHVNLNLTLFAFADMNVELIFHVRSIKDQISANLWIVRNMP